MQVDVVKPREQNLWPVGQSHPVNKEGYGPTFGWLTFLPFRPPDGCQEAHRISRNFLDISFKAIQSMKLIDTPIWLLSSLLNIW